MRQVLYVYLGVLEDPQVQEVLERRLGRWVEDATQWTRIVVLPDGRDLIAMGPCGEETRFVGLNPVEGMRTDRGTRLLAANDFLQ